MSRIFIRKFQSYKDHHDCGYIRIWIIFPFFISIFHISTYKDNPFLDKTTISEIERLKEVDENLWRVFGEGQRGVATETIFPSFNIIDSIPENASEIALGLDFGFSADPTSLVKIYKHDLDLYIDQYEVYWLQQLFGYLPW